MVIKNADGGEKKSKRIVVDNKKNGANPKGGKGGKKKSRNCCCSCLISFSIAFLAIVCVAVGTGWYFGDNFTRKNLNMSIGECFEVVGGLYFPNEKKIVTNESSGGDEKGFYSALKKSLFLKDSTELDLATIMNSDIASGDQEALGRLLSKLFTKENMDKERISGYNAAKHDEYLLTLGDKQLCAVIKSVLKDDAVFSDVAAKNGIDVSSLKGYGIEDIRDYFAVRQVTLKKENRAAKIPAESGYKTENRDVVMLGLTVQVKVSEAIKAVLDNYGYGFLHFLAAPLLPSDIFLTVRTGIDYDVDTDIFVNNIDTAEKTEKALTFIDGILRLTNNDMGGCRKMINSLVTETVRPAIDPYVDTLKFSESTSGGNITIDPFEIAIEQAGFNSGVAEADRITSKDLLGALKAVVGSDYAKAIEPNSTFKHQYSSTDTGAAGYNSDYGTIYKPATVNPELLKDYKEEFMQEVSNKYLIKRDPDGKQNSGDEIDFQAFMALLGVGSSDKSLDLMQLIDGKKMDTIIDEPTDKIKIMVTDRMMGAIVAATVDSVLKDGEFASYDVEVEHIILSERDVSGSGDVRQFMKIGLSVSVNAMMSGLDGMASSLVTALLSERVMISMEIDITRGISNPEETVIFYNDLSGGETKATLSTIGKIAGAFDTATLTSGVETPLKEMIDTMYSTLGEVTFAQSKVEMPDVFTAMSNILFKKDDGTVVVNGSEIREMLKGMIGTDDESYVGSTLRASESADNYSDFIADMRDKYYLKLDNSAVKFSEIFDSVSVTEFDSAKFDSEKLRYDSRSASELTPMITDAELARVFAESMSENAELADMMDIKGIRVGTDEVRGRYIYLVIQLNTDSLGADVSSLLPSDNVYVVATSYLDEEKTTSDGVKYYNTEITVNAMNEAQKNTLIKMLKHLQGEAAIDFDAQALEMGKVIKERMTVLTDSLGDGYEFIDGGIKLSDFYAFLKNATEIDPSFASEDVKGAIQGLYSKPAVPASSSSYNYMLGELVMNEIAKNKPTTPEAWFEEKPTTSVTVSGTSMKGRMSDKKFGLLVKDKINANGAALSELTVISRQTRTASPTTVAEFDARLKKLGETDTSLGTKDFVRIVMSVSLEDLMGGANNNSLVKAFLPETVYVGVWLEVNPSASVSTERVKVAHTEINNMTQAQKAALFAIAKVTDDKIKENTDQAVNVLNEYEEIEYVKSTEVDIIGAVSARFDSTKLVTAS